MVRSMLQARNEGETYRRVEVITGRRQRQNWSPTEKARIVAESQEPDANISEVARRNGVSRGVLTVWRRQALQTQEASYEQPPFVAIRVTNGEDQSESDAIAYERNATPAASGAIEVSIADARIRVPMSVDLATLQTVITALRCVR